jgi:hypothetical protein
VDEAHLAQDLERRAEPSSTPRSGGEPERPTRIRRPASPRAAAMPGQVSNEFRRTAKRLLPWLVAVGFFMEALDTTILNTAVPAIAHALNVPPLSMKAVLASYTLSLAVFIPISGWMANRFGTRRVFACRHRHIHARLLPVRHLDRHSRAGGVPDSAGLRRRHDAARRPPHHGAHVRQIRTDPRHELRGHSRSDRPDARAAARRIDHRLFSLERHFLRQHSDRPGRPVLVYRHLAELSRAPGIIRWTSSGWCCSAREFRCCPMCSKCSASTRLSGREIAGLLAISAALLAAYGLHSVRTPHPLLRLGLVRIRSFRVAVRATC